MLEGGRCSLTPQVLSTVAGALFSCCGFLLCVQKDCQVRSGDELF